VELKVMVSGEIAFRQVLTGLKAAIRAIALRQVLTGLKAAIRAIALRQVLTGLKAAIRAIALRQVLTGLKAAIRAIAFRGWSASPHQGWIKLTIPWREFFDNTLLLITLITLITVILKLNYHPNLSLMEKSSELANPIFKPEQDRETIKLLEAMLSQAHPKLIGMDGEAIPLPDSLYALMRYVIHMMAQGQTFSIVPCDRYLTTQEAANLLNVSRPYLYSILDRGDLAYEMVGTHRRIRFEDLMEYKQKRDNQRRHALNKLTTISQELGFYEAEEKQED
jgi:excisionase family DNA binding protein